MGAAEASITERLMSQHNRLPWMAPTLISVMLVIPCCWRPIVSSCDLQSHLYNAWLAGLIRSGSIHGLWIGHQKTNILLGLLLPWLLRTFGVSGAERITTSLLVLIFFWGAFQFISAVGGRRPYWLAPWLAILCYGFVFQEGLLNYYLSCGIVLWVFALLWKERIGWRILWVAPLFVLAYLAHPLPVLWCACLASYCWLARRMRPLYQMGIFLVSVIVIFLIRQYVMSRYFAVWRIEQSLHWTGADQILLWGWLYAAVAAGFLLFAGILLHEPENRWPAILSIPAQAYLLSAIVIVCFPSSVRVSPESAYASYISGRLSLLSAVLLLAILSRSRYRRWYLPAGLAAAVVFFGALYRDIGREARVEAKMHALVQSLPAGARVVSYADLTDYALPAGKGKFGHITRLVAHAFTHRLGPMHLVSRACLGHCFDYMNYEASTGQFRIHAAPGNPIVVATMADFDDMESGRYKVKTGDLPLYALFRCRPGSEDIRMQPLAKGEIGVMLACSGRGDGH